MGRSKKEKVRPEMETAVEVVVPEPVTPKHPITEKNIDAVLSEIADTQVVIEFSQTTPAEALKNEVIQATNGAPIDNVVWRAKKKDGTSSAVSLKFYFDCKLSEIENGTDCMFESLESAPVTIPLAASKNLAPAGAPITIKGVKKCSTC